MEKRQNAKMVIIKRHATRGADTNPQKINITYKFDVKTATV